MGRGTSFGHERKRDQFIFPARTAGENPRARHETGHQEQEEKQLKLLHSYVIFFFIKKNQYQDNHSKIQNSFRMYKTAIIKSSCTSIVNFEIYYYYSFPVSVKQAESNDFIH